MQIVVLSQYLLPGEALVSLLGQSGHFKVVGHSTDVHACLKLVKNHSADVVVAEVERITQETRAYLFGARLVQGFSLVLIGDELSASEEGSGLDTRTVPSRVNSEDLFDVLKSLPSYSERTNRPPARKRSAFGLSARERELVDLVAKGLTNRQIAEITHLRDHSVKNMVSIAMRKLRCENRTQLALKLTQASSPPR